MDRVNEELKRELSNIISYSLRDPKIDGMISVTEVKTSKDLGHSKVYVSILNAKNVNTTLGALKRSSGHIRSELAKKLNFRVTPELVFLLDESAEYGARIDSILNKIMKDIK